MPGLSGFVGAEYRSQEKFLDTQELINWYVEGAETPEARSPNQLLPTPGFEVFCILPYQPVRGGFSQNNRTFFVGGTNLYEVARNGTVTPRAMTVLTTPITPTVTPAPLDDPLGTMEKPLITHGGTLGSTTYGYRIAAVNENGTTAGSVEGTSNLGFANLSATNYNLVSWTRKTGAASYKIWRTTGGSVSVPRLVATVPANTLQFLDYGTEGTVDAPPETDTSGGSAGSTTYGYKISALLGMGETAASDEGVTSAGKSTLSAEDYIELSWPKVTNATAFNIYRTQGGTSPPVLIASVPVTDLEEDEDDANRWIYRDTGNTDDEVSLTPPTSSTTGTAVITDDGAPVLIYSSGDAGNQLLIVGGGSAFCYDLSTNVLAKVIDGASHGGYISSYFVVLDAGSSTLKVSESLDGFYWDPAHLYQRQQAGDSWLAMSVTHNELWLIGSSTTEAWGTTGNDDTRFAPLGGQFIEQGIIAPASLVRLQESLIWIGQNADGAGMVFRSTGLRVEQISTRGMERTLENMQNLADAVAWGYTMEGHGFYVVNFPTDNETWVYDTLTRAWHRRGYWSNGAYQAYRPQCHTFAFGGLGFGKHLVGDRASARVLVMSNDLGLDVDGSAIRRLRRAPHLVNGRRDRIFYDGLFIDFQTGVGTGSGQGEHPTVVLRYSDNGGRTWSDELWEYLGAQGEYDTVVQWTQLGSGRDRVYEIVCTDPVPYRIAGAHWDGEVTAG